MERWRCPACHRKRRKQYHGKVEIIEQPGSHPMPDASVFVDDHDFKLYMGNCLDVLGTLPSESVDCVVTSPPYWGLRDYRAEGQLGMESTPEEFVQNMTSVFSEARRILTPHGTCWVNLGDSYTSGGRTWRAPDAKDASGAPRTIGSRPETPPGLKPKDLVGIPWRVAFALQNDGWWLRSDIIWSKANPMPESVLDRPTRSHEYIFLLTKQAHYWWDIEAVREPHNPDNRRITTVQAGEGSIQHRDGERWPNSGRNIRSVWSIPAQPYPGAHFATFPEELARRAIVAGCPLKVCRECGKPSERIVERDREDVEGWAPVRKLEHSQGAAEQGNGRFGNPLVTTLGWTDCGHNNWRSGIVLDPFMGSGTVAKVARDHQRHAVGIELNPEYCRMIAERLQQLSLLA
jgi:DNA modification methylase